MSKKYEIKTMQDVLNCVTMDNIDNFLVDFRYYIESAIAIQNIGKAICEAENIPKKLSDVTTDGFTWIDDGKHNISIEMRSK
jgi:hypothetical protein